MNIAGKNRIIYIAAPLVGLIIYILLAKRGQLNYFNDLAAAFLHGRLHVINTSEVTDLVLYHGRYYLYWPPVPAFVMMPFVAIWGTTLPNGIISSFIGAINIWLFMKICGRLSAQFSLGLRAGELFLAGLFWGLGTVHFYLARSGVVWYISEVIAQAFLLAAIYFFLENKRWWRSGLCFTLAVYTRNDLVFSAIFFLLLYLALNREKKLKEMISPGLVFLIPFIIGSLLNCWYNFARFGSITDNGLSYHLMGDYFRENFNRYGYFSLHYIPHNFYTEVIHMPTLTPKSPFIKEEPEGFGFLWASPFFLWLIPALFIWGYRLFKRPQRRNYLLVSTGSLAAASLIALTIFVVMGTGWQQFAARYTLDFQAFLLIFLLFAWSSLVKIPLARPVSILLIIASWLIQLVGAL